MRRPQRPWPSLFIPLSCAFLLLLLQIKRSRIYFQDIDPSQNFDGIWTPPRVEFTETAVRTGASTKLHRFADEDEMPVDDRSSKQSGSLSHIYSSVSNHVLTATKKSSFLREIFQSIPPAPHPKQIPRKASLIEEAKSKMKDRILDALNGSNLRDGRCQGEYKRVDMSFVKECIRRSSSLRYPIDADQHFNEIRLALSNWSQHEGHRYHFTTKYHGPWIENEFVHRHSLRYEMLLRNNTLEDWCLPDIFGPYIPLLVPWTDVWLTRNKGGLRSFEYDDGMVDAIIKILRPDVPYLVVSQNDEGWTARSPKLLEAIVQERFAGMTMLSAGGYGHVPIPLIKASLPNKHRLAKPVSQRPYLISYVGQLTHAPNDMRQHMHENLNNMTGVTYRYYFGNNWHQIMLDSKFSLVPRGFGRTAYHLMEVLQLGLIPIYIYTDKQWIPYANLLLGGDKPVAFATNLTELPNLISNVLARMSDEDIRSREERILQFRSSHFTLSGAVDRIDEFMWYGRESDLKCQALPLTVRDE